MVLYNEYHNQIYHYILVTVQPDVLKNVTHIGSLLNFVYEVWTWESRHSRRQRRSVGCFEFPLNVLSNWNQLLEIFPNTHNRTSKMVFSLLRVANLPYFSVFIYFFIPFSFPPLLAAVHIFLTMHREAYVFHISRIRGSNTITIANFLPRCCEAEHRSDHWHSLHL